MFNVAVTELCKFLRGDVGTIPRLYIQLLTGRGYVKDPVYDEHGLLQSVALSAEARGIKQIADAVRDGVQNQKEKEARRAETKRRKAKAKENRARSRIENIRKKLQRD